MYYRLVLASSEPETPSTTRARVNNEAIMTSYRAETFKFPIDGPRRKLSGGEVGSASSHSCGTCTSTQQESASSCQTLEPRHHLSNTSTHTHI